jgi:hypothetical protein
MHPDSIPFTAVNTPLGLYEWLVMLQGLRNAPSVQQRRVTAALRHFIGDFCHVYLDDIIIWSKDPDEHEKHVRLVFEALKKASLYCNPKKTKLFQYKVDFLGHHISQRGVEADTRKVEQIVHWPTPKSATNVRAFLGLVRYISGFLHNLADHTAVLEKLTTKACDKKFPEWSDEAQAAFDAIKSIVVSRDCLTTIDHDDRGINKIFVTTDASDKRTGGILSYGPTWETARPVAFDSMTLKSAQLNYPVHEKEMLAIIRALQKWRVDLLGSEFYVYTDHKTLENFDKQKDLSRRQARWMEFLSQYDCKIIYVKGEDNSAADALSRTDFTEMCDAEAAAHEPWDECADDKDRPTVASVLVPKRDSPLRAVQCLAHTRIKERNQTSIASVLTISSDAKLLQRIHEGYEKDP